MSTGSWQLTRIFVETLCKRVMMKVSIVNSTFSLGIINSFPFTAFSN